MCLSKKCSCNERNTPLNHYENLPFHVAKNNVRESTAPDLIKRGDYEPLFENGKFKESLINKALTQYKEERKNDKKRNEIDFSRLRKQRELASKINSPKFADRKTALSVCYLYPAVDYDKEFSTDRDWASINREESGRTYFGRVATCNCGFCVHCGVRKALKNESELLTVVDKAIEDDLGIYMLTFNVRHTKQDDPKVVLGWLQKAVSLTMKDNRVKKLLEKTMGKVDGMGLYRKEARPAIGCFTALEAPFGKNGFHPHYHKLLIAKRQLKKSEIKAIEKRIWGIYNGYFKKLSGRTLSKNSGVHLQALKGENAKEKAAKYFVKNGLVKELTGYANKNRVDDEQLRLFDDDFLATLKNKELGDVQAMVQELISTSSITHLGMIDLCLYFEKIALIDDFKAYAMKQHDYWANVYQRFIQAFYGVKLYRFSNGLKGWAGLQDNEDEELEEEEQSEEVPMTVQAFSVPIFDNAFKLITSQHQEANLLYIASFPAICGADMSKIIGVLDDIARLPDVQQGKALKDYVALLLAEQRLIEFDVESYKPKRIDYGLEMRNGLLRDFALKFEADKRKRATARPVVYSHPLSGEIISRDEAEQIARSVLQ